MAAYVHNIDLYSLVGFVVFLDYKTPHLHVKVIVAK